MWFRTLSPRPGLLVDPYGAPLVDPAGDQVGRPHRIGRDRLVHALPLSEGPRRIRPDRVVQDSHNGLLGDPSGNLIGHPGIVVARMAYARWSSDSRRLSG